MAALIWEGAFNRLALIRLPTAAITPVPLLCHPTSSSVLQPSLLMMKTQHQALATELAVGPTFAQGMTNTMLQQEWAMTIEQAVEAEAQAQAICMQTQDFRRAYEAFSAKQKPVFGGN